MENFHIGNINHEKILLQYSGGKDSTTCVLYLLKHNLKFEAIHFTHPYAYDIPTIMAKDICKKFNIRLHVIDIKNDLEDLLLNNFNTRPCRFCKAIMDRYTVKFALKNNFNIICVGDTNNDKTLINRIKNEGHANLTINKYFNKKIYLPNNLYIYRPLIVYENDEIFKMLRQEFPEFRRVNDTGDKYFEYSREGCPLQFKDLGVYYNLKLMTDLKIFNAYCSEYATINGIRASIHLPSEFIVTIPKGYENDCRNYLLNKGCKLKIKQMNNLIMQSYKIHININEYMHNSKIIHIALNRFIERLYLPIGNIKSIGNCTIIECEQYTLNATLMNKLSVLIINLETQIQLELNLMNNIVMEIFHTYNFKLQSNKVSLNTSM